MRARRLERRETTAEGSPAAGARRTEEHHARRADGARQVADAAVVADVERSARQNGREVR